MFGELKPKPVMKQKSSIVRCGIALVLWLGLGAAVLAGQAPERPFLHPLFCDHLVLQRDAKVPVWGWAAPGTKVTVSLGGQTKSAVAQSDGKWMVHLGRLKGSTEPRSMTVTESNDGQSVTIKDVLVGDVWLCSGQSNMEMGVEACDVPNEIAQADFPQIRLLTVPRLIATQPVEKMSCQWLPCSPATIKEGLWAGFSAAGFFFGREVYKETKIPIALIHSSWGGTV